VEKGGADEAHQVLSWHFKYFPAQAFDYPPLLSIRPADGEGHRMEGVLTLGWVRAGLARFEVWLEDDGPSDPRYNRILNRTCCWFCLFLNLHAVVFTHSKYVG
jgi:hypothetical protein